MVNAKSLLFILVLCTAAAVQAEVHEVQVYYNLKFIPKRLVINPGDTVRFVWVSSGGHNVVSGQRGASNDIFSSGGEMEQGTYEVKFSRRFLRSNPVRNNVYRYFCDPHWHEGMTGTIKVRATATQRVTRR